MRRENEIRNYIILGGIVAGVLFISLMVYFMSKGNKNDNYTNISSKENIVEIVEDASTEIGKNIEEKEKETTEKNIIENTVAENIKEENKVEENTIKENKKEENNTKKEKEVKETSTETKKEVKFSKPISGSLLREFAKEKLVYSDTLKEWVTHNGVDIKADKTAVVAATADGKIYAIKNDPRYGLTVIINHDDGYQTVYSNLLTAEFVVEGEEVKAGQNIGTVGNSASFEVCDEYHLHFEILKDKEYLDPAIYISFE